MSSCFWPLLDIVGEEELETENPSDGSGENERNVQHEA